MKFNLNEKIEEIRQKPEHVRIRYVWGLVAVSMFFIVLIWLFSVKENFKAISLDKERLPEVGNGMRELKGSLPSLDNLEKSLGEAANEENTPQESISNLENNVSQNQ